MRESSRHHAAEIIAQKTLKVHDAKQLAREVAAYLLHEHKTAELESLIRDILQYRADHGVVEATIVSANKLSEQVRGDIRRQLHTEYKSAKDITLNESQEASVIGGIRIDLPNEQLDLTTANKLHTFKRLTGAGEIV